MDTILHVEFIIFAVAFYGTIIVLALYLILLILLGILLFICWCGQKLCECLLMLFPKEKESLPLAEPMQGTHFLCTNYNVERIKKAE